MLDSFAGTAVVVPIRGFRNGKTRLKGHLPEPERAQLAQMMASQVVRACHGLPVAVVTSAVEVISWAQDRSLTILRDPGTLDAAASSGVAWARASSFSRVVIVHADLPYARTLAPVLTSSVDDGLIAVIGNRDGGSPVLSIPATTDFVFSYGADSLRRHVNYAVSQGLKVRLERDPSLSLDLDTAEDLARLRSTSTPGIVDGSGLSAGFGGVRST
jgi:2-phospho-L-lactate guanylyltransferase